MTTVLRNAEAAAMIGCTPNTLNFWRGKGRGPKFIKFGDAKNAGVGYDVADIEAWKAEHRFQSTGGYAARVAQAAKPQPAPSAPIVAPWLKADA
jgi:hypothetical protein